MDPLLCSIWDALLGFGKIGAATVHWIEPGGARQQTHVDYPCHVRSGPCWRGDSSMLRRFFTSYQLEHVLPYFSVQTLLACDAMDVRNGSTEMVPGSQRWEGLDSVVLDADFAKSIEHRFQSVTLGQGDLLFFNRRLAHRGGHNGSDRRRNAIIFQNTFLFGIGQHDTDDKLVLANIANTRRVRALDAEGRHDLGWRLRAPYPLDTRQTT
jgi:ectoine hydroxylase-related dioxygenase (phytanoyl-CoA dioxygenase family)